MKKLFNRFFLRIGLANDTTIRSWSFGEVRKAETINYKTEKPVLAGLFCEKIFGPVKDNECACGKYRRIKYKGKICSTCDVLVTESIVRRRRLGHIELQDPIVHVWFYRSIPSPLSVALDMAQTNLERLIQYKAYAVVENNNDPEIKLGEIIDFQYSVANQETKSTIQTKALLRMLIEKTRELFAPDSINYIEAETFLFELESGENATFFLEEFIHFINDYSPFKLETGGDAIEILLKKINMAKEIIDLKKKVLKAKLVPEHRTKIQKRLRLFNNFLQTGQKLEWMTTRTIPVLPPELRPIVHLEGGRFATSGINKLYSELLIRKNRLVKHQEKFSPLFMLNQLKALVQEAADVLFDKSLSQRHRRNLDPSDSNTRSIAENLKGKTGRFRSNLLGKRIDYSAGSVIVGGPDLKLDQCGLPRDIAVVLFRSMIIGKLLKKELAINKKIAEKMINERHPVIWDILEELVINYPILLNRAPTLHRLGIQGFYPKLIRGKAIQLHPLTTIAFNADFDGDRMAIHLPLTENAKQEVRELIMSSHNILNPRNGQLIMLPSQDMILGIYYLTIEDRHVPGIGAYFDSSASARQAYHKQRINLHAPIFILAKSLIKTNIAVDQSGFIQTTVGKLIFNEVFGEKFAYINERSWSKPLKIYDGKTNFQKIVEKLPESSAISKGILSEIINQFFEINGQKATASLLDELKSLGFIYSTRSGTTISFFDLIEHQTSKKKFFAVSNKRLKRLEEIFQFGGITKNAARQQRINEWTNVKEQVEKQLEQQFIKSNLKQSIYTMVDSGARGSLANLTQLVGMRGLMVNTRGEIIDTPIKSSLVDGLNYLEFFISTYGARKGMVDTAMKTSDSGYLTRRLVDVAHDFYTVTEDCQPTEGFTVKSIVYKNLDSEMINVANRIYGRFTFKAIIDRQGNEIVPAETLIGRLEVEKIKAAKIDSVIIRSILTCRAIRGSCQKCFGLDLSKNRLINRGQAIGVLAAQSIGEPATQLTMRTFHTGGVSDVADITQGLPRVIALFDVVSPKKNVVLISKTAGQVLEIHEEENSSFTITISTSDPEHPKIYKTKQRAVVLVKVHELVQPGTFLTDGEANVKEFLEITQNKNLVAEYIINEVQKVYFLQGIDLSDKYIEIIVRKIMSFGFITDPGESTFSLGDKINNYRIIMANDLLRANNQNLIKYSLMIQGIKATSTKTYSFLSAASFQETTQVLISSILDNRTDELYGLKENVIVGNLIPVGTGSPFSENWLTNKDGTKLNPLSRYQYAKTKIRSPKN